MFVFLAHMAKSWWLLSTWMSFMSYLGVPKISLDIFLVLIHVSFLTHVIFLNDWSHWAHKHTRDGGWSIDV